MSDDQESNSERKIINPEGLLQAYQQGMFPMADSRDADSVEWYTARKRGIIPISDFHVSKNVQRIIRQGRYSVQIDRQFRKVVEECANRDTTWINDLILDTYEFLHEHGYAHSVECYEAGKLVGGLYGVHIQSAFFGESMFKKEKEADKVALYYCWKILKENNFELWDTQFYTDHLAQFGCIEIDEEEYMIKLERALQKKAAFRLKNAA